MKIFNTKTKIVLVLVAGLVITGVVSAALVDYLSNKVQADITVDSPMLTGISSGLASWDTTQCVNKDPNDPNYDTWVDSFPECDSPDRHDWAESNWTSTGTLVIPAIYGGEPITLYTMSENLANAEIVGFEEAIVTNLDGVTCDDFTSVKVQVDSIYGSLGYGTEHELIGTGGCQQVTNDPNRVQFGSPDVSTWGKGETDVSKIVVTFQPNAEGTYTFTYQVVPVP